MIVHCQIGEVEGDPLEVGQVVGAERLEADARALEDDRLDPRLRCHRPMVAGSTARMPGVNRGLSAEQLGGLLDERHLATLATVRADGSILLSPHLVHLGGRRVHPRDGAPATASSSTSRASRG